MDFSKGEEIAFPGDGTKLIDVRISPDGRWLTGESLELKALYVVDATGKTYKKIPYQAGWGTISHWINDSTIIIQENGNYPLNTLFAINPFTQEVRELPHLFPDIDKIRSQPWDYSGLTIYDPTLQLVVYPELSSDGNVIVLWDLGKNDPVVRLLDPELNPNPMPRWSQDGEKFVFTGLNDHPLTLIYRDGRIKNSEINLDDDFVPLIDLTSWSPDGRYLAFWIEPRDDHDRSGLHLMVWDTRVDRVIDTCIPSDVYIREIGYDNLPLWSPDGKYLAVKTLREVHQEQGIEVSEWDVEVIDFQNELTVKVAKNSIPLGWLTR
jgi:Tol biopolymer transport system component